MPKPSDRAGMSDEVFKRALTVARLENQASYRIDPAVWLNGFSAAYRAAYRAAVERCAALADEQRNHRGHHLPGMKALRGQMLALLDGEGR